MRVARCEVRFYSTLHHVNPDFFTKIGKDYLSSNGQMAFFGVWGECNLRFLMARNNWLLLQKQSDPLLLGERSSGLSSVIWFAARRLTQPMKALVMYAKEIAQGNLAVKATEIKSNDEMGQLGIACNDMTEHLQTLVKAISQTTDHVAASSEELSASAEQSSLAANQVAESITDVAQGSGKQLQIVNETSKVMEQMVAGIQYKWSGGCHLG